MSRCSLVLLLALASVIVACERTPTLPETAADARSPGEASLGASAAGPSVTGGGTITFGQSVEHVSVNVRGTSGLAVFHDKTVVGNFSGQIEINCVRIVGNEATLSGIVRHSNEPPHSDAPSLEGFEALFQLRDNGEGSSERDLMSPVLFHEVGIGPNCLVPSEFDLVPAKGNFTIRP